MTEPRPLDDDSIDLVELFLTLWDGRWKIISTVFLFIAGAFGYFFIQPPAPFTAITEIKPISSLEAEKYTASNAAGLFDILPSTLQNLYMEKLGERTFFEQQILSLKLLDRDDYPTEADYNDAVISFASKIEIMPPPNNKANEADNEDGGIVSVLVVKVEALRDPSPNCPCRSDPQANTRPSAVRAKEWSSPAAIAVTFTFLSFSTVASINLGNGCVCSSP